MSGLQQCDYCRFCVASGETKVVRKGTKYETGGRVKFWCVHPSFSDRQFVGYGGEKYPYKNRLQTIKTYKRFCPCINTKELDE